MGGTIQVTSDGKTGSKFSFSIPFKAPTRDQIKECEKNLTSPPEIRDSGSALVKQNIIHQKLLVAEVIS